MGHCINALIGTQPALAGIIEALGTPPPTRLPFDLLIVPLDHNRLDLLAGRYTLPCYDGFIYFGPNLAEGICRMGKAGQLLYVETAYFGGQGGQGAAVLDAGRLIWKDAVSSARKDTAKRPQSPINYGLAMLGVKRAGKIDEFDAIGLNRFRSLEALELEENDDAD